MAWTTTKRVCKALYFSLQRATQIDMMTEFEEAGLLKMNELLFYNQHASADLRKQEAIILSFRLDNEFVTIYKARYENGASAANSIAAMTEVLINKKNSVENLSDVVDTCYQFKDERNK